MPKNAPVPSSFKGTEYVHKPLQKTHKEASKEPRVFPLNQVYPDPRDPTETIEKNVDDMLPAVMPDARILT
ncbi:hypothetical protein VTI74DRAFT_1701 [Chaetomium olivicolor]